MLYLQVFVLVLHSGLADSCVAIMFVVSWKGGGCKENSLIKKNKLGCNPYKLNVPKSPN